MMSDKSGSSKVNESRSRHPYRKNFTLLDFWFI